MAHLSFVPCRPRLQIFRMFRQACNEQEEGPEKQVLTDICRLYGLWQIEEQGASFLKCKS